MIAFAVAQDVEDYTKGAISASDPRLPGALAGASTGIRRYCGWHIAPVLTMTVKLDGPGGRELALPTKHLTALPEIVIDGDTTLVDEVDYRWSELGEVKRLRTQYSYGRPSGFWPDEYRGIVVTMTHGYALDPDPDDQQSDDAADIKQLVIANVARGLSSPSGATREQAAAMSVSWATVAPGVSGGLALMQHELDLIDTYRL